MTRILTSNVVSSVHWKRVKQVEHEREKKGCTTVCKKRHVGKMKRIDENWNKKKKKWNKNFRRIGEGNYIRIIKVTHFRIFR